MKQIIKKDRILLSGTGKEIIEQIRLLSLKYNTIKELLDSYNKSS